MIEEELVIIIIIQQYECTLQILACDPTRTLDRPSIGKAIYIFSPPAPKPALINESFQQQQQKQQQQQQ
jgi:hypothetical protein